MYKDSECAVEARVDDLLQRMTLKEKVAQTLCVHVNPDTVDDKGRVRERKLNSLLRHGIGQLGKPNQVLDRTAEESAHIVNRLQAYVIENKRYRVLLSKLVRERLYQATCFLMSDEERGLEGGYREPDPDLVFSYFLESLRASVATFQKTRT